MRNYIEFQISSLTTLEKKIERDVKTLACAIFKNKCSFDTAIKERNDLFQCIDCLEEQYRTIFSFEIYYSEHSRLSGEKQEIDWWIKTTYPGDI